MKREFTIGVAWSGAASWLEQGAGVIVFLLIARLVGAEAFGVATMAFAFLFLGEFLVRDTITEAIVERKSLEDGRLEATFFALIGFSLAIVVVLCIFSGFAAALYGEPDVAPLIIASSPTVLLVGAAGVSTALLRRELAYKTLAIRTILGVVSGGIIGISMALNDFGAWSLIGQRLTQAGINSAFAIKAAGWMPQRWPRGSDFSLLKGLGPRVVALRSLALVIVQTPTVALGIFAGPVAVGMFAFAWRMTEIVLFLIVNPLKGVAQSAIAEMRRRNQPTAQFYLDLTELAALCCFTGFAGLALISQPLIRVLVGPEWHDAGTILPVLCIAGAISALTAVQEAYLLAIDRLAAFVSASLIEIAIGIVIIVIASPLGPTAVGAAVALRILIVAPLRTNAALTPETISWIQFARTLISPVLVAACVSLIVGLWLIIAYESVTDVILITISIALGIATFCILLFGFMPKTAGRLRSFVSAQH